MIEDLKHFHAEDDPWQLIDEPLALIAFLCVVCFGVILLRFA